MSDEIDFSGLKQDAQNLASSEPIDLNELLKQKLDDVDLLIADLGQLNDFNREAADFAKEARTEIRWNRIARVIVLGSVAILLILLCRFVWVIVDWDSFARLRNTPLAFSTAIAAAIGGGVVLSISVTKAVFSSFAERNAGVPMPEHFKAVIDAVGHLFGK